MSPSATADDAQFESITPEEIGLPTHARMPLRFRPGRTWTPLVISFPHVGLAWPHDLRPKPQVDFARNADYEVQTLYRGVQELGVATVEAVYSRLVCDLNRADDDVSSLLVPEHPDPRPRRRPGQSPSESTSDHGHRLDRPGRGVVWASAVGSGGGAAVRILDRPLELEEFERRMALHHRPYYRAVEILLERRRRRFGYAILLDAHSMPSSVGIDLVLGTLNGRACDQRIVQEALHALSGQPDPSRQETQRHGHGGEREAGRALLSVRVDDPYRGGEMVRRFGKPRQGIHAFQLEVSRRLYMDEDTYDLWAHPPSESEVVTRADTAVVEPRLLTHPQDGDADIGVTSTDNHTAASAAGVSSDATWARDYGLGPDTRGLGTSCPSERMLSSGRSGSDTSDQHQRVGSGEDRNRSSSSRGRHQTPPAGRAWRLPPGRRRARELAELLDRVRCLVRRLALQSRTLGLSDTNIGGPAAAE